MSKGMTAFWEWMEKKGYGVFCLLSGNIEPIDQMLEGYMREFLYANRVRWEDNAWRVVDLNGSVRYLDYGPFEFEKVINEVFKVE